MIINKEKKPIDFEACERISAVYEYLNEKYHINKGVFAKQIGITAGHISDVLGKKKNPGGEMISGILFAFAEISAEWLMRGTGEILQSTDTKTNPPNIEIQKLNDVIKQLQLNLKATEKERDIYSVVNEHYRQIILNLSEKGGTPEEKKTSGGLEQFGKGKAI